MPLYKVHTYLINSWYSVQSAVPDLHSIWAIEGLYKKNCISTYIPDANALMTYLP